MDVTGRTESDPAAEALVRNILGYVSDWKPGTERTVVYAGDSSGESYLRSAGVTLDSWEVGAPSAGQLLVAGPGAGPRLAANAVGITAWLKAGGHVLAIGLNEADANAFLPRMVATTVKEYIAAYFELFGAGSPFTGVSPAEVHSRSPRELSLDSGGATVVGNGVLARADDANIVFSQLVPWQFDYSGRQMNIKRTLRRVARLTARLLANLGAASRTPLLERFAKPAGQNEQRWLNGLYLDVPEEWDDPYRFFRWQAGRNRYNTTIMKSIALGLFASVLLQSQTSTWRPVYLGMDGMVATAHYATAMAGYRMLTQGGNAVDAAAAACFASTVVEPSRSGIGGDAFILIYRAKTKEVLFINGGGWAPKRATAEFFEKQGGIPLDGPLSPVVPGAPAALLLAHEELGKLRREQVLAPAIELAERGFVVSENLQNVLKNNVKRLQAFPSSLPVWFRDGQPLRMGDVVVRKNLGQTLRRIAAHGRDGFYRGAVAQNIVGFLGRSGGIMDASDLAEFTAEQAAPLHVRYRGYDVYGVGLPTQSPVMLMALKVLEGYDLRAMGHNSADYIHHVVEALKLAFADREVHIGDPRFVKDIPIDRLLSDDYARQRRSLIRKDRAIDGVAPPGLRASTAPAYAARPGSHVELTGAAAFPDWIESFTTHIDAVDADRNMVTITSSVASNFGSAMYVDGEAGGFFINDVLARFHLDPKHPNGVAPRKRPRQTLNPVLVCKDGKPLMVFGSPGGDTQGQSQLQFFLNFVDFGMNVQRALEQPYFSTGSYHLSFHPHPAGKGLSVSQRIPREVREELAKRGHPVRTHSAMGVGSVKAIVVDPRSRVLMGGAAPATDGYVIGW